MKPRTLIMVAMTLVAGCGATVHSSTSPNANLSQYHTFALYTSPYKERQPVSIADQDISAAIKQDLSAKGMKMASQAPDFLVSYHVIEQQKVEPNDVGYGVWGFGPVDYTSYTQGTLVVDFIDARSRKVFWRGTASEAVDDPNNVNRAKLDPAVAKLIDQYPVGAPNPEM